MKFIYIKKENKKYLYKYYIIKDELKSLIFRIKLFNYEKQKT
jgi:hypothetical protein